MGTETAANTGLGMPKSISRWVCRRSTMLAASLACALLNLNAADAADVPVVRVYAKPQALSPNAVTADWPRFLGPKDDGTTPEEPLRKDIAGDNLRLLWEMDRGEGYAAPSIAGDRLVVFHREGDLATVDCLHPETATHFWRFTYPTRYRDRYDFSGGPRCSPVIDGDRVYTFGAEGMLHCLNLESGEVLWKKDVNGDYKVRQDFFGAVATPLVYDDLLIVNVGAPGGPCVVAFDKKTGTVRWTAGDQWGPSCASPIPATIAKEPRILVFAGGDSDPPTGGLLSLVPTTGEIELRFPFRSKTYTSVNAASPVAIGDDVFLTTSYRTGGVLVRAAGDDRGSVEWKSNGLASHFSTPIHRDGVIYGIDGSSQGDAVIVALDPRTGKQLWQHYPQWEETIERNGKPTKTEFPVGRGSLILADGDFLCQGEMGHLAWLRLSRTEHHELSFARPYLAKESWTPPVISHGLLYLSQNAKDLRTGKGPRLLCYDLRGPGN